MPRSISTAAFASVDTILARLRTRLGPKHPEEHYLVGIDGKLLSKLVGTIDEVITGGIPVELIAGAISIHQHPGALAFPPSENDLVNALAEGPRFVLVVAADGIHRLGIRQPRVSERYALLLDRAETMEHSAAIRVGWHGGTRVSPRVHKLLPAAVAAEIMALAAAYPEFLTYRRFPLDSKAAVILS